MAFGRLVRKEVMSVLRSPAFVAALVLMLVYFVILGRAVGVATEQVVREALESAVGVIDEDRTPFTSRLLAFTNITLGGKLLAVGSVEEGLRRFPAVVVIPGGFGASLLGPNATVYVRGYVAVDRASVFQGARARVVELVAGALSEVARGLLAAERGVNVTEISKAVVARVETLVGGRILDVGTVSSLLGSTMMLALFTGILAMMTLMYSAQAVAGEKEEKAFEMLLTLPVSRTIIALAKIAGAVVVSALMTAIYFAGFSYVMSAATPRTDQAAGAGLVGWSLQSLVEYLGSGGMLAIVASLGLMLLFSGALGLLVGILSGDTRVAGAIAGPIGAVLYFGLMAAQFVGVPLSAESALLGATVYGLPLAVVVSYLAGERAVVFLAVGAASLVVALVLLTVVRVFGSERILIGVSLRRRRRL